MDQTTEEDAVLIARAENGLETLLTLVGRYDDRLSLGHLARAVEVLSSELTFFVGAVENINMPLAAHFPNGDPAPRRPSPKQLLYLLNIRTSEIALESASDRTSMAPMAIRPLPRPCVSPVKGRPDDDPLGCAGFALPWIERSVCYSHASVEERETNKKAQAIYTTALWGPLS